MCALRPSLSYQWFRALIARSRPLRAGRTQRRKPPKKGPPLVWGVVKGKWTRELVFLSSLLPFGRVSLFDETFLRPDANSTMRRAQLPSRLAVAQSPPRVSSSEGHALTAARTARGWNGGT